MKQIISFPGLGLHFNLSRTAFTFFSVPVYWYGVIIALGFTLGVVLATIASKKLEDNTDIPIDLAIFCGPVGIICARLYYVLFKLEDYIADPLSVFDIRSGGLAIYGGVIGGVVAMCIYCKVKKHKILRVADIGCVGLITGQMIGRWGNFFNQEAFGSNTSLPWGMTSNTVSSYLTDLKSAGAAVDPNMPVHPTFLYESLWCLGVLIVLLLLLKRHRYDGQMFFAYGALYGLGRFWIESLRTDSLYIGSFRISQLIALLSVVIFGFLYFYIKGRKEKQKSENLE